MEFQDYYLWEFRLVIRKKKPKDFLIIYFYVVKGIAAFFLKKFSKKKPSNSHRLKKRVSNTRQTVSPSEINAIDDSYTDGFTGHGLVGHYDSRNTSAVSRTDFFFYS